MRLPCILIGWKSRAIAHDTCVRMKPRASPHPSKLLRDEGPLGPQYSQRPSILGPPHPRAVVNPHERRAGVLVAQDDVDEAVNKANDAHLEAEAANERADKAERTANEIRQSSREPLGQLRKLKRQVHGHAQAGAQPRPTSSARRARREGQSSNDTQHSALEPDHGAELDNTLSIAQRRTSGEVADEGLPSV